MQMEFMYALNTYALYIYIYLCIVHVSTHLYIRIHIFLSEEKSYYLEKDM